jgi:hypothetical protein
LAAEAADFGNRHAMDAALGEGVFYVFELEMANDRFNFFHDVGSGFDWPIKPASF